MASIESSIQLSVPKLLRSYRYPQLLNINHPSPQTATQMDMDNNNEGGDTQLGSGSSGSEWPDLTHECLTNILSRLTLEERWLGPMLVCKSWLQACKDPSLHTVFDLNPHFDSTIDSPRYWTPDFERKMDSMLQSVVVWSDASLTAIHTRHCSDRSLLFAAQRSAIFFFFFF
jgi:hypothetical protein